MKRCASHIRCPEERKRILCAYIAPTRKLVDTTAWLALSPDQDQSKPVVWLPVSPHVLHAEPYVPKLLRRAKKQEA